MYNHFQYVNNKVKLDNQSKPIHMKVFFDFDGTLTTRDSLLPFIIFIVGWPMFILKLILLLPVMFRFIFNRKLRGEVKNSALQIYLSKYSVSELNDSAQRFIEEILPTIMRPEGIVLLKKHILLGHECILVSASLDLYLSPWAKQNGFSNVISTPFLGTLPKMIGTNCYGEEKVKQILKQYPNIQDDNTYAYGDTSGDIPMLKLVKHGAMWSKNKKQFIPINN